MDADATESGRRVIPPGGLYPLVVVVWVWVFGMTVINAGRGEWGLAVNGVILTVGLMVALVSLPPPSRT